MNQFIVGRLSRPVVVVLGVIALGACAPQTSEWSPSESVKENRVTLINLVHEVGFGPGQDRLSDGEAHRLVSFLQRDQVGYGDRVFVAASSAGVTGPAARAMEQQQESVAAYLRRLGLSVEKAALPANARPVPANRVPVVVARYVVTPPACPDWSKVQKAGGDFTNTVNSNFGCANISNLGLMVANPADLLGGRAPGPADGEFSTLSIQRYRKGEFKPLETQQLVPAAPGAAGVPPVALPGLK